MAEIAGDPLPLIDMAMPRWRWREFHQRMVHAPLTVTWDAALSARMGELVLTRPMMVVRGIGQNLGPDRPIFQAMPPQQIAARPPQELLLGLLFPTAGKLRDTAQPDSITALNDARAPGLIRQVVNLRLHEVPGGTLLTTETRAIANDRAAERRFAIYWVLIRPGSGLIRRDVLRAIARRAEAGTRQAA